MPDRRLDQRPNATRVPIAAIRPMSTQASRAAMNDLATQLDDPLGDRGLAIEGTVEEHETTSPGTADLASDHAQPARLLVHLLDPGGRHIDRRLLFRQEVLVENFRQITQPAGQQRILRLDREGLHSGHRLEDAGLTAFDAGNLVLDSSG